MTLQDSPNRGQHDGDYSAKEIKREFVPYSDSGSRHFTSQNSNAYIKRENSLLSKLTEIDREILHLIAKRSRILASCSFGRETGRMEKELRNAWEKQASKLSRDPLLIRQTFALLQQIECRSEKIEDGPEEFYNLNPSREEVNSTVKGPGDCRLNRILISLSAACGSQNTINNVLINDPLVEIIKAFNQISPCLRWEDDGRVLCRGSGTAPGLDKADKSLLDRAVHVGNNLFNFLLVICTMAVRPCRLKLIGATNLKLADFSPLRHFLPSIGARFISIVPGQDGLPARLEASGMIPDTVNIPKNLCQDTVMAVCLGLFSAPRVSGIRIDLSAHPKKEAIFEELRTVLGYAHLTPRIEANCFLLAPEPAPSFVLPQDISVFMDMESVLPLLCVPAFVGGSVEILGTWPENSAGLACLKLLEAAGLDVCKSENGIIAGGKKQKSFNNKLFSSYSKNFPESLLPLAVVLAAMGMRSGKAELPEIVFSVPDMPDVLDDFLPRIGLRREGEKLLPAKADEVPDSPFSSPTAIWGVALALGAFLCPNRLLTNPGSVVERFPGFWQWYNGLPKPGKARPIVPEDTKNKKDASPQGERIRKRRIRAGFLPENEIARNSGINFTKGEV